MKLLLIHTGGTIGMVRSTLGFVPELGLVEACVARLTADGTANVDVVVAHPLIDSANATPQDWNWITAQIAQEYDRYDGFIVTHGTDTMAFCAAALAFALEGLAKPVILTGAMLPLSEEGTDGVRNLADAIAAVGSAPPGVWVQFAGRLWHGTRVRKSHSTEFDAFNASAATAPPCRLGDSLIRHEYGRADVPVLAVSPGMSESLLRSSAAQGDGVLLRCYGSGTVPRTEAMAQALETARAREIPVMAVSQCAEGGLSLGTYAAGALLRETGVVDGRDATVEAAYAKLLLALSTQPDPEVRRAFLARPLCGEFAR